MTNRIGTTRFQSGSIRVSGHYELYTSYILGIHRSAGVRAINKTSNWTAQKKKNVLTDTLILKPFGDFRVKHLGIYGTTRFVHFERRRVQIYRRTIISYSKTFGLTPVGRLITSVGTGKEIETGTGLTLQKSLLTTCNHP